MIRKSALILGALSLAFVPQPAATVVTPTANYPDVRQVFCMGGSGTAFRIRDGRMISVAHVTSIGGCRVDDQFMDATPEEGLDFSVNAPVGDGRGFKINCDGFVPGRWYFAVGFAGGAQWQTMTRHLATYMTIPNGMRVLLGSPTVIPGMSGGPIVNEAGEVVGVINAYLPFGRFSFSRELKDTSLCRNSVSVPQ
jgi:hypothetical protein